MFSHKALSLVSHSTARLFSVLISLALIAATLPAPAPSGPPPEGEMGEVDPHGGAPVVVNERTYSAVNWEADCANSYRVQEGDTLADVAAKMGVPISAIILVNGLKPPYHLVEGEVICKPVCYLEVDPYADIELYAAIYFSKRLAVWGSHFPKKHSYYVKVRASKSDAWVRLGKVKPDEKGKINAYLRLPVSMRKAKSLYVCLKEVDYGYVKCTRAYRYGP